MAPVTNIQKVEIVLSCRCKDPDRVARLVQAKLQEMSRVRTKPSFWQRLRAWFRI